ncbi:unnamed protein product [Caenorhabditis brenneri]
MDFFYTESSIFWLYVKVTCYFLVTVGLLAIVFEYFNRGRREEIERHLENYSTNEDEQQEQQPAPPKNNNGKKGGNKKKRN